jgi:branched-chain amino acid transport system substrate-binding protein
LKTLGAGALALGTAGAFEASWSRLAAASTATGSTIRIGYVTPKTGDLSDFSASDNYVLGRIRASSAFASGITVGGKKYRIEIIPVDSQSDPNRASQVTQQLVLQDKVDLVVTSSAPETTNPVALECQQLHVPSLATVVPWESWYAGLGGNPLTPTVSYEYATMFFFGVPQFDQCFVAMWNRIQKETGAAKVFAGMFPNDADGNAFRDAFPPPVEADGYKFVDGGAYTDGTTNYSSMIEKFKAAGCEFFVNCPLPPDFNTFWKQAEQEAFKPRLATVAKVLLFPSDVIALGSLANNIATDAWWTPVSPYKSSLTGESAKSLAVGYETSSGNEWIQSMGSTYSLFEVAVEALAKVDDPHDKAQLADALHKVSYNGICGPINFAKGPAPGVGIIQPVGIQWKPGKKTYGKTYPYEAFVVDNTLNKDIPLTGDLEPTNT